MRPSLPLLPLSVNVGAAVAAAGMRVASVCPSQQRAVNSSPAVVAHPNAGETGSANANANGDAGEHGNGREQSFGLGNGNKVVVKKQRRNIKKKKALVMVQKKTLEEVTNAFNPLPRPAGNNGIVSGSVPTPSSVSARPSSPRPPSSPRLCDPPLLVPDPASVVALPGSKSQPASRVDPARGFSSLALPSATYAAGTHGSNRCVGGAASPRRPPALPAQAAPTWRSVLVRSTAPRLPADMVGVALLAAEAKRRGGLMARERRTACSLGAHASPLLRRRVRCLEHDVHNLLRTVARAKARVRAHLSRGSSPLSSSSSPRSVIAKR